MDCLYDTNVDSRQRIEMFHQLESRAYERIRHANPRAVQRYHRVNKWDGTIMDGLCYLLNEERQIKVSAASRFLRDNELL
jgi:hypothetical protein